MVLYRTAYTLGIEPFFSAILMIKCTANLRDGNYFVIFGSFILLSVMFCWSFKLLMIPDSSYWDDESSAINYFS
jgi:hypothetical protein